MPIAELASYDPIEGVCWLRWAFDLDPATVWTGLTDPVWLRRWLGTPRGAFALGEASGVGVTVTVEHGDAQVQRSTVRVCLPPRRLEVSWEFPGEATSVVDVRLAPAASGTELTLTHTGLAHLARDYAIGWHAHLLYLAAALRASPMALDRFWDVHERVSRAYHDR